MSVRKLVRRLVLSTVLFGAALVVLRLASSFLPSEWRFDIRQMAFAPWLSPAYLGDGRPATDLLLCYPMGLAFNRAGELLISDRGRERRGRVVWRIDSAGIAHILAGSGLVGDAMTQPSGRRVHL